MEMRAVQSMKRPKLFWVSAGAPLVSVIVSTLLVFASKANNHGISVVSSCMNYEYPQTEKVRNYLVKCFTIITKVFNWFCLADWKITRRIEPTFMAHVALPWHPPGTGIENRACHWHFIPHCKFLCQYCQLIICFITTQNDFIYYFI